MIQNIEVLVVEDEVEIRQLIALHLQRQGFLVSECETAEQANQEIQSKRFSLVVLDWMLPRLSGIDIVGDIKKLSPGTNVLMVTAKADPQDIVFGLEKGADDYLTKPFEVSVLLARVRALLRRGQIFAQDNSIEKRHFEMNGLTLDLESYDVQSNGIQLHLTPSEFKLLLAMVKGQGRVLTRDQLIDQIQGEGVNVTGRTVDTHVFGLRKKLGQWSENIETIRGVGYRIKCDNSEKE